MQKIEDFLFNDSEVYLDRILFSNHGVIGKLSFEGRLLAYTLERPWYDNIRSKSCVPEDSYRVAKHYSPTFRECFELRNVTGRSHILIHSGNVKSHTEGCILVGKSYGFLKGELAVLNSRDTFSKLLEELPDTFTLHIKNKSFLERL